MMNVVKDNLGGTVPQVLSFGFGYGMDSELLGRIADWGTSCLSSLHAVALFPWMCTEMVNLEGEERILSSPTVDLLERSSIMLWLRPLLRWVQT